MQNSFNEIISNIRYVTADKCFIIVPRWATFLAGLGNVTLAKEAYNKAESMNPNIPGIHEKIVNLSSVTIKTNTTKVPEVTLTKVSATEISNIPSDTVSTV